MSVGIKAPKKLIEVALPLDDINVASAREKSIRHGHPSTLHLWWARRPLAAARAVLFAQLVNDPGGERGWYAGKTKAQADEERERLFDIIRDLVKWENTNNETVLERAREAIRASWRETCELNKGKPGFDPEKLPAFHDPFAGGGSIPLEAQRLGLEAHASDLNPVAVLINKAMIEIPPRFAGRAPVRPEGSGAGKSGTVQAELFKREWKGAEGLAEDVRYYGNRMREEAFKRIGHLYPPVEVTAEMANDPSNPRPDLKPYVGKKLTVIAWIWARTVKSPNPAFAHVDVPLASTFMLSTKVGKEAYVAPVIQGARASGPRAGETPALPGYRFTVRVGQPQDLDEAKNGTKLARANFRCVMSNAPISGHYIKEEGKAKRMGSRLMVIVAEGERGRVYLSPTDTMEAVARKAQPEWQPEGEVPARLTGGTCVPYGLEQWGDLFTLRQLVALSTFSDLISEAREQLMADYLGARASRPRQVWHSRGYLPHYEAGEHPQTITFRLCDSLPRAVLDSWRAEIERLPEAQRDSERRKRIDAYLDAGHGTCWLGQEPIAQIVADALAFFDGERYRLHAWCLMPNHVHVLVTPLHGNSLSAILQAWKSFSAKAANKVLGRQGAFWEQEYFDRAIRNDEHFATAWSYIEGNPVKAGLCDMPQEWLWSSAGNATRAGRPRSQELVPLDQEGTGALAYAEAVGVYLTFVVEKLAESLSNICTWSHLPKNELVVSTFRRQAIPMTWDFGEANPFATSSGSVEKITEAVARVLPMSCSAFRGGSGVQANAQEQEISVQKVVSTDPPYYDNISYSDLSDFFYVWLRRSLKPIFPDLFATLAVPKAEELVATPYRHGSKEKAEAFFLGGMTRAMHRLVEQAHPAFPATIYYAFKQSETPGVRASRPHDNEDVAGGTPALFAVVNTGWETFLGAVMCAGFTVTGTWPIRTERDARSISIGTNALASSIVLVCRKRDPDAPSISRRDFQRELRDEMPEALETMIGGKLGVSPIAPVDLAQAAIGPGMAIYSKYAAVLEADGSPMPVHNALVMINKAIEDFLNPNGAGLDADTLFCSAWFDQLGWGTGKFGEADTLARAKGTSVDGVAHSGVVESGGGNVRLLRWEEYPRDWDPTQDNRTPVWDAIHQVIRALNQQGESAAGALLARMPERGDQIRQLAYHLYTLCERKKWADDARAYNELIAAWHGIVTASHETGHIDSQGNLDL